MLSITDRLRLIMIGLALVTPVTATSAAEPLSLTLRYQQETAFNSGRFHRLMRSEDWNPEETAIVVCDVWDYHHSINAVKRLEEFAPRLNDVLTRARQSGVMIIHSPSDCMPAYESHPARQRAIAVPNADFIPLDCESWCSVVPAEERAVYPIDQSDGGDDDDPQQHAEWAQKLKALGRNPNLPWQKQSDMITIDEDRDYISDRGDEVWNILQQRGIRNVILTGVHTNMCVTGRPFGLRQMARNGKNVVLMRDMTDTMYNPNRWPFVSHFTGTDLIVSHIERYICPTITSDQILRHQPTKAPPGWVVRQVTEPKPFRFAADNRPHLVMLIAEEGYRTNETLPAFAASHLGRDFRVTTVFGSETDRNHLPGIEAVKDADVLLISIRRRALPKADLQLIRDHVAAGKPVVGIRTASHAFALSSGQPPEGHDVWPELDAEVFGGNYHGAYPDEMPSLVALIQGSRYSRFDPNSQDPVKAISDRIPLGPPELQGSHLYRTSPLADGTQVLMWGSVEGNPREPVTWTYQRPSGGRSFYTSMGHPKDFESFSDFQQLLYLGICWTTNIKPTKPPASARDDDWQLVGVPDSGTALITEPRDLWYRCAVRLSADWATAEPNLRLILKSGTGVHAWLNGTPLNQDTGNLTQFTIPPAVVAANEANLLVVRVPHQHQVALTADPFLIIGEGDSQQTLMLGGQWQRRAGDDPSFANMPLPAKFGASTNILFAPEEPLWTARPVTRQGEFTTGIEGPACDADGNIFAVNFQKQGTIGRVSPQGSGEVFVTLPEGSIGNGIRFDRHGNFFVADYPQHNILKVDVKTRQVSVFAHDDRMNQPNDLAMAPDGTLYASDPNWKDSTGQLWRIDADGTTTLLAKDMGTTNGIEVSPDGRTLYVNESVQRNVWAFDITAQRTMENKRLIRQFPDHGFDGMRCDIDGNLFITRHGKGTVIKMTPQGEILQEIHVLGTKPSNLCFGGTDGRTVYVTEVDGTRLVAFRTDRPGRSWSERQ
ncbi:MAG: SMP-30/gluconolactonase/LRE family protein [Planctomycetaceae bacterium]